MKPTSTALARLATQRERWSAAQSGFTLAEVMVSLAIVTLLFGGMLAGYIQLARKSEWSGLSLAAQSVGIQIIEQARSAVWDPTISKNELTNMNLLGWSYNTGTKVGTGYSTSVLDLPVTGTNIVMVTNFVTVRMYSLTGFTNAQVQMVTVNTVWPFQGKLFTNRAATYYGPDNRADSSL